MTKGQVRVDRKWVRLDLGEGLDWGGGGGLVFTIH